MTRAPNGLVVRELRGGGIPVLVERAPAELNRHDAFGPLPERIEQIACQNPMSDRTKANLERALRTIDPEKRAAFLARHADRLAQMETVASVKYADLGYWAYRNVLIAEWLDLDRSAPIDILDIGTGSGNFLMVAQSMGHRGLGTDVSDAWYDELLDLTGVERVIAPVERGKRYKPTDNRFDLVTIMLPTFHRKKVAGSRQYWSIEEWRVFLLGLTNDLLKSGGAIFILMQFDKDDEGRLSYSPLMEWARRRGAILGRLSEKDYVRLILFDPASTKTFGETPPEVAEISNVVLDFPGR
jgi:hypothetical protein